MTNEDKENPSGPDIEIIREDKSTSVRINLDLAEWIIVVLGVVVGLYFVYV